MALDRLAQLAVDIVINARRAQAQLSNFQRHVHSNTRAIKALGTTIGTLGLAASIFLLIRKAIREVHDAIKAVLEAFTELQTQIVDVQKIAKAGDINKFAQDFINLSLALRGINFDEVSKAMSAAARSGIPAGKGLEELTKAALLLAQTSADISGTEAAEGLAALNNNFKLNNSDSLKLANSMDALSDAFNTTSGQIITTSARLSGFADAMNISVEETNALSAALLSSKQSATVIRTTIINLFTALTAEPLKAAAALRLTEQEMLNFAGSIRANPIQALRIFVAALNKLDPTDQAKALEDLGLSSARVSSTIRILQSGVDNFERALGVSETQIKNTSSILGKHNLVASTAEARVKDLKEQWTLFKATIISVTPLIDILTGAINGLRESLTGNFNVALPDLVTNLSQVNARIASVKQQIADMNKFLAQPRTFLQDLFGGHVFLGVENKRRRLVAELNILEQQRLSLLKQQTEEQSIQTEDLLRQRHEFMQGIRTVQRERIEGIRGFLENIPTITVAFTPLQSSLFQLAEQFQRVRKEFSELVFPTMEARQAMQNFAVQTQRAAQFLIQQDRQERRRDLGKDLGNLAGKFGEVVEAAQKFQELINNEIIQQDLGLRRALAVAFMQQINDLFKKDKPKAQFRGLTDAWKDAQLATQKEDELTREQLVIAQRMAALLIQGNAERRNVIQVLNAIARKEAVIQ